MGKSASGKTSMRSIIFANYLGACALPAPGMALHCPAHCAASLRAHARPRQTCVQHETPCAWAPHVRARPLACSHVPAALAADAISHGARCGGGGSGRGALARAIPWQPDAESLGLRRVRARGAPGRDGVHDSWRTLAVRTRSTRTTLRASGTPSSATWSCSSMCLTLRARRWRCVRAAAGRWGGSAADRRCRRTWHTTSRAWRR